MTYTAEQVEQTAREVRYDHEPAADMLLALLAEREAMRKDAERYRWLRESSFASGIRVDSFEFPRATWDTITGGALDAAIDASLADAGDKA